MRDSQGNPPPPEDLPHRRIYPLNARAVLTVLVRQGGELVDVFASVLTVWHAEAEVEVECLQELQSKSVSFIDCSFTLHFLKPSLIITQQNTEFSLAVNLGGLWESPKFLRPQQ